MSRTMSRFALSLVPAALFVISLASCGDSNLLQLDHSWGLTTVQDSVLPYSVPNTAHDIVITSALADLKGDNTYTITFTGTSDGVAGQVGSDHGNWSVTQSTFTFTSATISASYIAALVSGTFRASVPGQLVGSTNSNFNMLFTEIQ
jgi:hypothetical protein